MNVVYHSGDLFAPVTGISMVSLFENNKNAAEINVYIIENKISEENKNKLLEVANKYTRKVYFIPMPDINTTKGLGLKKVHEKWLFDSYCRLFLDELLPKGIDRVIYLDGDTIVNNSLEELWNTDMQGKCLAAVMDPLSTEYYEIMNVDKSASYCNSGVLLFDIEQWHKRKIGLKVIDFVNKAEGYVFFMEQTVFNAILAGEIFILHPKYNVYTLAQVMNYEQFVRFRKPVRYYEKEKFNEAVKDPYIIHLTNCFMITNRGWIEKSNHPMTGLYQRYVDISPWKEIIPFKDKRKIKTKVIDFGVKHTPKFIIVEGMRIVYNKFRVNSIKKQIKKYREYK